MVQKFQPGDAVHHASNPEITMVVETIRGNEVYCTWPGQKTSGKREGNFSSVSLRKVDRKIRITAI